MTQKKYNHKELKEILLENECIVEFTKVDGEKRTMPCTLDPTLMPPAPKKETTKKKKENLEVMNVWCIDKKSWRSFRIANITDLTIVDQIQ